MVHLWCRYVHYRGKYRHYRGNRHYSATMPLLVVPIRAKRFHRHCSGQPALPNRHYRETTTVLHVGGGKRSFVHPRLCNRSMQIREGGRRCFPCPNLPSIPDKAPNTVRLLEFFRLVSVFLFSQIRRTRRPNPTPTLRSPSPDPNPNQG